MVDGLITQPCKSQWLGNLAWRRGLLRILARRIAIQSGTNYQLPEEDSDGRIFCSAQTIFRLHDIQQFCTCLSTIFQGLETCNFLCSPWYQLDSSPWVGHKHPRLQAFDSNPATQKCVFRRPKLEISIGQCRNQMRLWNMMKRCLTCASLIGCIPPNPDPGRILSRTWAGWTSPSSWDMLWDGRDHLRLVHLTL